MSSSRLSDAQQADARGGDQQRLDDAELRDAGGEQGGQFLMPGEPRDGEHGRDHRQESAHAVEERQAVIGVVRGDDAEQVAFLFGVGREVVEVAEEVDDDVEADEADEADDEDLRGTAAGGSGG